jgi:hypothetical protein
MTKIPKVIRTLADLRAIDRALSDPDERVRLEAAQKLSEKMTETLDPSAQVLKGHRAAALSVFEKGLDDANPEVSTKTARVMLQDGPEGLRILEKKPILGIERARKHLRDWKKRLGDEEQSCPPN